jgi:hypothetical protein
MATPILTAATGGNNSSQFIARDDDRTTVFVTGGPLVAEEITIEITHDNGISWNPTGLKLTAAAPLLVLPGPGTYRAVKPSTANAAGVAVASRAYSL